MYLPDVEKIYLGVSDVKKIMLGDVRVWPVRTAPEYVDCGCIRGNGTSDNFITLPFNTSGTLKYRFVGQFLTNTGGTHIGAIGLADSNDYRLFMQQNGGYTFLDMGNKRFYYGNYPVSPYSAGTPVDITVYNFGVIDNFSGDVIKSGSTVTSVPSEPMLLNIGRMEIDAFMAWETSGGTDELIYDGEPKIRVADNQAGLYDNVSGTFSTNSAATIYACYGPLMYRWVDASGNTYDAGTQQGLQYSYSPDTIVTWLGGSRYYNDYIWFKTDNGCEEPFLNGNGYMYFEDTLTEIKAALYGLSTTIFGREEHYLEITQIPNTVTDMTYAFFDNYALKSCVLPSGVRILNWTFDGAINLTGCTVPDGVETIRRTFFDCQSMKYLSLPASLTAITSESIVGTRLTYIQFRGTVAQWNAIAKDEHWQYDNASLTEIRCTDGTITL